MVESRNSPFMQVLYVLFAVLPVANKAISLWVSLADPGRIDSVELADIFSDFIVSGASIWALAYTRTERFGIGAKVFLFGIIASLAVGYWSVEPGNLTRDPLPLFVVLLAGLLFGRRMLWTCYGLLSLVFLEVAWLATLRGQPLSIMAVYLAQLCITYALIGLLVDHTTNALRSSYNTARIKAKELEDALTELGRVMSARESAEAALTRMQKFDTASQLAVGVIHDVANNLSVISAFAADAERLADGGVDALICAMEEISKSCEMGFDVIDRILDFAKREKSEIMVTPLSETLEHLAPLIRKLLPRRASLDIDVPDDLELAIDPAHFQHVIMNLSTNAGQAISEGGTFSISASSEECVATITIRDTGSGMDASTLRRAFEPLFSARSSSEGVGLGLAIVKELVEHAGGQVELASSPGTGTTVTVRLSAANLN